MRVSTTKINRSLDWTPNYRINILNYDSSNIYPQLVQDIVNSSSTAKQCTKVLKAFLYGKGFADEKLGSTMANSKQTFDNLLKQITFDYAIFNGFAIHVNYNAKGQVIELNHVPFEFVRYKMNDTRTDILPLFAVYDNWDLRKTKYFRESNVTYYNEFNPNTAKDEFKQDKDYKGQLFYFASNSQDYPLSIGDSVIEDMITDAKIKIFKFRNITTNFMGSHLLIRNKIVNDDERNDFVDSIQKFQGADNAGKIMQVETDNPDMDFKLLPLSQMNNDRLFEYTEKSVKDNIREAYGVPPVLMTGLYAGKLGASNEMQDAYSYFNNYTYDMRVDISDALATILKNSIFGTNLDTTIQIKENINDNN